MKCVAKTLEGLEEILENEIIAQGGTRVTVGKRVVTFHTDQEGLYRMNYTLRTAISILVPIAHDSIRNADQLYAFASKIKWENYLNVEKTFSIKSTVYSEYFNHSQYAGLKLKDAIADYFRRTVGSRPNVEKEYPDIRIDLHIDRNFVNISLDSSGTSLYQRGYRKFASIAPLNEVLASGLIQLTGWDKKSPLIDPMCGAGTLPIEAHMLMCNIPAGYFRVRYGFQDWFNYDKPLWRKVKEEMDAKMVEPTGKIYGYDLDREMVEGAKRNTMRMPFGDNLEYKAKDFLKNKFEPKGTMVLNPPYDQRIGKLNILEFYEKMGNQLKRQGTGSTVWIFSGNMEAMKKIGLRPSAKLSLMNGNIPCKFHKFEMYEGSKKNTEAEV